jgi:hypothetical protein
MRHATLWVIAFWVIGLANAQTRFPMKYLDEVGHLGNLDPRKSVNLGIATVFIEPEGDLRFEGHDIKGKPWRAWIRAAAGVGGTDVWSADFDRNGHRDLLIAAYYPRNGRCIDEADIYTLMFDALGRPVPWRARSNSFAGYGRPPIAVVDANGDGRAEIVTVSCEYAFPSRGLGEDRRVSGIYEARNARWRPAKNISDGPYLAAAKRHYGRRPPGLRWLPTDPALWPDFLAGFDERPLTQAQSLATAEVGCGGVSFPIVDGQIVRSKNDPCDTLKHNQIVFSDGEIRQSWPFVVIDSSDGRDIFLSDSSAVLRNVLKMGYRFKALGDPVSPDLLWVELQAGEQPGQISSRLRTREPNRTVLAVKETLPSQLAAMDITFTAGQRCFVRQPNNEVVELASCPALSNLVKADISGAGIRVSEGIAWQILPQGNALRSLVASDGRELETINFESAAGASGNVYAAVPFHDDFLVEWHSGLRRWLVLHSANGRPLTTEMALPVDGELFDSQNYNGLQFLNSASDRSTELILVPASVEWSRMAQ